MPRALPQKAVNLVPLSCPLRNTHAVSDGTKSLAKPSLELLLFPAAHVSKKSPSRPGAKTRSRALARVAELDGAVGCRTEVLSRQSRPCGGAGRWVRCCPTSGHRPRTPRPGSCFAGLKMPFSCTRSFRAEAVALGPSSTRRPTIPAKHNPSPLRPAEPLPLFAQGCAATPSERQHTPSSSARAPKAGSNRQNQRAPRILTSWRNNRAPFSRQSLLIPAAQPTSHSSARPTIKVKAV